ncbi:MAG: hypothetical protein RDU25_05625 [Patescibacteria group bacterium]|nr:hypothetical protein [Patescibacteria group bacterium]
MPKESMPPFAAPETPKRPSKLGKLAKAAALAGALALPAQEAACAPVQLTPLAEDAGKTQAEVRERRAACDRGIQEARAIKNSSRPVAAGLADQAEFKFSSCYVSSGMGVWDEKGFQEAQALLKQAKETKN